MIDVIKSWYRRNFSDPQAVILALLLVAGFIVVIFFGQILAPLLASVIIAYLMEGIILFLQRKGVPRLGAVIVVFTLFILLLVFFMLGLIPLLSQQVSQFLQELPRMISKGQQSLIDFQQSYPNFLTEDQVRDMMSRVRSDIAGFGQNLLSKSLASIPALITLLVYLILVPLLVFFFLKDKQLIVQWFVKYLPDERKLAVRIWQEMDQQIGNYVRGKFFEIIIVGVATYIVFALMGLNYAPLLAVLVGLSVLVPYIGATVVTFPVMMIAYFQWGWSSEFGYLMLAYGIIQALDGNVLVPLLFSEAVNLHPIAIIVAVLFFGGIWGFWGVFFAIPLATLVKAVLNAWPNAQFRDGTIAL